jgi:hypothetical protein
MPAALRDTDPVHFPQNPPSTATDIPVVKVFAGDARKRTAGFNSIGVPHRPMGTLSII